MIWVMFQRSMAFLISLVGFGNAWWHFGFETQNKQAKNLCWEKLEGKSVIEIFALNFSQVCLDSGSKCRAKWLCSSWGNAGTKLGLNSGRNCAKNMVSGYYHAWIYQTSNNQLRPWIPNVTIGAKFPSSAFLKQGPCAPGWAFCLRTRPVRYMQSWKAWASRAWSSNTITWAIMGAIIFFSCKTWDFVPTFSQQKLCIKGRLPLVNHYISADHHHLHTSY